MKKADLQLLVRRTKSDPTFRQRLLADPEVAVSEAGWDLSPDDMSALRAWHAGLVDTTKLAELERSLEHMVADRMPRSCE